MTEEIRFADAIELTQNFVVQLSTGQLTATQITHFVANLVATTEGARGFFVGYLTSTEAVVDRCDPAVLDGLAAHPTVVADLLVKNLVMSVAQELHFQQQVQPEMAANSQRVARRSQQLIANLNWPELSEICQKFVQSITAGSGAYTEFLNRWGYNGDQRQAIQQMLVAISQRSD